MIKARVIETSSNTPGAAGTVSVSLSGISPTMTFIGAGTSAGRLFDDVLASGDTCIVHIYQTNEPSLWMEVLATFTAAAPDTLTFVAADVKDGSSGAGTLVTWTSTVTCELSPSAWMLRITDNATRNFIQFDNTLYISYVSSTSIKINGGGRAVVNGKYLEWSGDITWSGTSGVAPLAAAGLVYGYLYDNAGTPALEVSTTAPELSSVAGYWAKTGDTTRRCVWAGYVWSTTAPVYRIVPFTTLRTGQNNVTMLYRDDYVDGSNAFDRADLLLVTVANSNTSDVTPTSFALTYAPLQAVEWLCDARMDGGSSGGDGTLTVSPSDRVSANTSIANYAGGIQRMPLGASQSVFFGESWKTIVTAQTAYYAIDVFSGALGCRLAIWGWRMPI